MHTTTTDCTETALRLLAELGSTAEEIADNLAAKGVTGRPRLATKCALAQYLNSSGLRVSEVLPSAYTAGAMWFEPMDLVDGEQVRPGPVLLPDAANEFALRFDKDEWPDLVAPVRPL